MMVNGGTADARAAFENPARAGEPADARERDIDSRSFRTTRLRLKRPPRRFVAAVETAERQSTPFKMNDLIVTAQAAPHPR
jgi:hypothetical protein